VVGLAVLAAGAIPLLWSRRDVTLRRAATP
jgi:hypothetical protein